MPSLPRNLLLTIIIIMTLGMLFVGLYPFNYFPKNQVSMNENGGGLHFLGRGIAYSTEIDGWPLESPITLELQLKPDRTYYRNIPHILSLCDGSGREVMYLGQWKNSLIIRLMEDSGWMEIVKREIGVGDSLNSGEPVFITLVLNKGIANIYVNGLLAREFGGFDLTEAVSKRPIRSIVLGNSSTGDSSWRGQILRFSAFNTALSSDTIQVRYVKWGLNDISDKSHEFIKYGFEELEGGIIRNQAGSGWNLRIFKTLTPLRKEILSLPSRQYLQEMSFYKDAVINVVGFIPLGLALTILFAGAPGKENSGLIYLNPVIINGLLSLFIETNQVFLVYRTSSMTDLILNILGSGLGVAVYWGIKKTSVQNLIRLR